MQFHFELIKFTSNTYLFTAYLPISVGIFWSQLVYFCLSWYICDCAANVPTEDRSISERGGRYLLVDKKAKKLCSAS